MIRDLDKTIDELLTMPDGWQIQIIKKMPNDWFVLLERNTGWVAVGEGITAQAAILMAKSEAILKDRSYER